MVDVTIMHRPWASRTPACVVDAEHDSVPVARLQHPIGVFHGRRERLLAEDSLHTRITGTTIRHGQSYYNQLTFDFETCFELSA